MTAAKAITNAGTVVARSCASGRLSAEAGDEARATVTRAFERIEDVLEGRVSKDLAFSVLKAAQAVADAVAGKETEKVEHAGSVTMMVTSGVAGAPSRGGA